MGLMTKVNYFNLIWDKSVNLENMLILLKIKVLNYFALFGDQYFWIKYEPLFNVQTSSKLSHSLYFPSTNIHNFSILYSHTLTHSFSQSNA